METGARENSKTRRSIRKETMTKLQQSERAEACAELRETLKPGTTVYTILRNVSRSGMSRDIDVYVMEGNEPRRITFTVAKAAGMTYNKKSEAIRVGGCGMDMGHHVVYNLSRSLYREDHKFVCDGREDCPSNDHNNAYSTERQGQCIVCRKEFKACGWTRKSGRHAYNVCSEACATGEWIHSDGGYALKHRWM